MPDSRSIAVLGAGSWGTALAIHIARANDSGANFDICMWDHNPDHVKQMQQDRCNAVYMPGVVFPDSLKLCENLQTAINQATTLLIVVPSHAFRSFVQSARPFIRSDHHIVWATKGLEEGTNEQMHQIIAEELPECKATAVISGPTFAKELAQGLPTAITVAASSKQLAAEMVEFLHHGSFRAYTSDDMTGVELGGSLKNVLAIAAGIADGLGFGANTRAALITRGLAEIMRLGHAMGAHTETFMGLAGLGDLVLTCTDNQSRNRRMGLKLAEGLSIEQARDQIGQAVEGVKTAKEAWQLAQKYRVDMPIIEQTYRVLYEGESPKAAVDALLGRESKAE
ncbi:MAG: NAD(P)-dependent glycerol-3-phosphate dehydrogenase [Gammaproteobacteria bacterium]|nr:NAD(P)-dependent glycerol-3-phosphate dehydrogenase [Gammaproteobacteria bacterium]